MEEELLELNVSYNEFNEELGSDIENELLSGEEKAGNTGIIPTCDNVEPDCIENDALNTCSSKNNVEKNCIANETQKDGSDTMRDCLKSQLNQNSNAIVLSTSGDLSMDPIDPMDLDNELSAAGKRRRTGISSETRTELDKEMCSDYEEEEKMEVQAGTKRKRGGRKNRKREKLLRAPVDTGIGKLLKPIDLKQCKAWQDLAREIVYRLNEPKKRLIFKVVEVIGVSDAWSLFKETVKAQKNGGLWTHNGQRRRSNGGVFLHLLKAREYATEEQLEEIFLEENEIAKKIKKNVQNRTATEAMDCDLRKIIDQKKSELLAEDLGKL